MKRIFKALLILIVVGAVAGEAFAADVTLYVTRHGKTMFNTVHRAQGWADTPLTPAGVEVAQKLGRGLQTTPFIAWDSDSESDSRMENAAAAERTPGIAGSGLWPV